MYLFILYCKYNSILLKIYKRYLNVSTFGGTKVVHYYKLMARVKCVGSKVSVFQYHSMGSGPSRMYRSV